LSGGRGGLAASSSIRKRVHVNEFDQGAARLRELAPCSRREFDSTLAGNFFKPAGDYFEPAGIVENAETKTAGRARPS